MIGETISHYRVGEKLGEGGMGVVYKAEDTKLKRTVALKFLPPELTRDPEAKDRFLNEAQAAAALSHSNICTIYEVDESQGQFFIAMEYIEGQSLKAKIEGNLPKILDLREVLDIASQVGEGLREAHERGIVHRDIKPANITINTKGQAKITDFGLAKLRGQAKLTKEGTTLGTVAYMSPEQAKGEEVDHRTDIWSLGIMLYEMITGQRPFKGEYDQAVVYSILNEEPEPITGLRTGVPLELERIVNKCLKKDITVRYQSSAEIAADLKGLKRETTTTGLIIPRKRRISNRSIVLAIITALIVITGYAMLSRFLGPSGRKPAFIDRKSIAVLPFKNMVTDAENEWFSHGITEDIITQLSKIGDLRVISRTSVMLYKDSEKNLKEIGEELGVATILEGSVRRSNSRVRIVSQLIDARTDEHIWAETYDRDLSDVFAIQSDVAQQIAQALQATLSPEEKERIEKKPTDNLEAYDYYLQGNEYAARSYEKKDLEIAVDFFEKAVEADPDFALAHAGIALQHCRIYWYGQDRIPERLVKAKEAIDRALNLKPDEPSIRAANGLYYYWGLREYARALDEFSFAQQKETNNGYYAAFIAWIQRRLGKFEKALLNQKIAFQYDPRSNSLAKEFGYTYWGLRLYKEAEDYFDLAISLAPDIAENYINKAWTYIYKTGDTESARQVLDNASKRVHRGAFLWDLIYLDIYDEHHQDALDKLAFIQEEVMKGSTYYMPKEVITGWIYKLMGQADQARTHFEKARTLLEKMAQERSGDARIHAELGKVYAHLGLKDDAIREGQAAVDLIPVSRDAMVGPDYLAYLAEIYTIVGDRAAAMENLEYLLEIPAGVHVGELKVNPVWDPLREHPRFEQLLKTYSKSES